MDLFITLLSSAVLVGTPILYGTIGEILGQKSGSMNLGAEGMMLMGAVIGFKVGYVTGNPLLALSAAAIAGALGSLIFAFITITLRCNQTITGLTLTIFGQGFSNFIGSSSVGSRLSENFTNYFINMKIPLLGNIPFVGPVFFQQNILVYTAYLIAILAAVYMYCTRAGLRLKMVGENPAAADAIGVSINKYRYLHILAAGVLYGIGGAYICFTTIPTWQNNIVAGKGWIAVTLVIFAAWNPLKAWGGSILFGLLCILGIRLQKFNLPVSQYFFDMLPYLMTVVILFLGSFKQNKNGQPAALGKSYFRESR